MDLCKKIGRRRDQPWISGLVIAHGFYADCRGFILYSDDCVPFPLPPKQLHYLVQKIATFLG